MRTQLRILSIALATAMFASASAVSAQDVRENKSDTKVEIRMEDGKVWINGEEVPEDMDLNEYLREHGLGDLHISTTGGIRFGRDGGGRARWFDGDGIDKEHFGGEGMFFRRDGVGGNTFAFGDSDDAADTFVLRNNGKAFSIGDMDFDFDNLASFGANELMGYWSSSPEIMKKEQESRTLARDIRKLEGGERAERERDLDALLSEIFDAKMQLRRDRIEKMENKLQDEQDVLDARMRERADIIARRRAELLGDDDRFDW